MQNPNICDVYSQHAKEATVAVYAPSGYYIASGGKLLNLYHEKVMYQSNQSFGILQTPGFWMQCGELVSHEWD